MKDNLARSIYAQKIATEIADHYENEKREFLSGNRKECEGIVFAISGKWGEGKTALLKLLEKPLLEKSFKVIWFNPWKYSQEDITLKRAFLGSLKEQLSSSVDLSDLYFDRTKTSLSFDWRWVVRWSMVGTFLYFIALPGFFGMPLYDWIANSSNLIKNVIDLPLTKPLLTLILIPVVLELITVKRRGANVSTAEEFERKFKELLEGKEKIVFFIDDLDRCTPKTVKTILDSLRTFFQHPECSYVITGDHTVVERYAGEELELPDSVHPQQKLQEGRRFLKKLFDVYWRLPLPTPNQFGVFVDEEINNSKIKLDEQHASNVKSFLIDNNLFERNPRHVKRFITKLRFALEGVDLQKKECDEKQEDEVEISDSKESLGEILNNPDLLAKVLLFEEFFYPVYEQLVLYPEELISHEKTLRKTKDTPDLKIRTKSVLELLYNKQEEYQKYISLVSKTPTFTDQDNSTIHEVANYFSFSGSTGLPSALGPDESNFVQYLRAGQLESRLGAVLEVAKKDRKSAFAEKALSTFDVAEDGPKTTNVLVNIDKNASIKGCFACFD